MPDKHPHLVRMSAALDRGDFLVARDELDRMDAEEMVPYTHMVDVAEQIDADVNNLSVDTLTSLLNEYDLVRISMRDGRWTKLVTLPPASPAKPAYTSIS